jgi:uncharacterized protein (DUF2132 family)
MTEENKMSTEELKNSPLHGLSTETLLTELVEFYDWDVLAAAVDLKCFRIEPTIPSCLIFLKRAEWARNRVEDFYLYQFKRMPKASDAALELTPRERGFPNGVLPQEPIPQTVETVEKIQVEIEEPESNFKSIYSNHRFRK